MKTRPPTPINILQARGSWRAKIKPQKRPKGGAIILGDQEYIDSAEKFHTEEYAGYSPFDTKEDCIFDPVIGGRVLEFFEKYIVHVKGSKTGDMIQLEDWQAWFLANLFGWHTVDGSRRYREAFVYCPRKNGKSFLGSGIGLYGLHADECLGSSGSEIYCAGASKDNARVIFDMAKQQTRITEPLADRSKVMVPAIERELDDDLRWMKPIPADASTQHGGNAQIAILDEIHAQPSRHLYDVLRTSVGARENPLVLCLTTADFLRESVCNDVLAFAKQVRDDVVPDKHFFPLLYYADKEDDWKLEATWRKANPNYGVSINADYLKQSAIRAEALPSYLNTFLRLHLNVQTQTETEFINLDLWDEGKGRVDEEQLLGETCYCGIDLSSVSDFTALSLVFPRSDGSYKVVVRLWVPHDTAVKRDKVEHVPYMQWAKQGLIELMPGNSIDQGIVEREFYELGSKYKIKQVAIDSWNAHGFAKRLENNGIDVGLVSPATSAVNCPTKEFETLYLKRKLHHGGHKVLRWMASNVVCDLDANANVRPNKKKSADKIDGIVSTILAIGLATTDSKKKSYYSGGNAEVMMI